MLRKFHAALGRALFVLPPVGNENSRFLAVPPLV